MTKRKPFRLVGISGSLREASHNTGLLRAFGETLPEDVAWSLLDIGKLPHFNADLSETDEVLDFKGAVFEADGLIIATPEYNFSVPGVLKNALDWASRPAFGSPLFQKPVGVLSAAAGGVGGARAQGHLKGILHGVVAQVFPHTEFLVARSFEKFSESGELRDAKTKEYLEKYKTAYLQWLRQIKG